MCFSGTADVNYERQGTKLSQRLHQLQQGLKKKHSWFWEKTPLISQSSVSLWWRAGWRDRLKILFMEEEVASSERHQETHKMKRWRERVMKGWTAQKSRSGSDTGRLEGVKLKRGGWRGTDSPELCQGNFSDNPKGATLPRHWDTETRFMRK